MLSLKQLEQKRAAAITRRSKAKQHSSKWFTAKAEIEDLTRRIGLAKMAKHNRANPCPADFVFNVWDDDD